MKERDHLVEPRYRWKYSIKMELKEILYEVVDWVELAQDRDRRLR